MESLPEGYSYDIVSDGDSDCQIVRIKEIFCVDGAKVTAYLCL